MDLAKVAQKAQPKLLVTYHRIYHMEIQDNTVDVEAEMSRRNEAKHSPRANQRWAGGESSQPLQWIFHFMQPVMS